MSDSMVGGVAVVTRASGGVGRATAVAFARRGFDVALLARGPAGLEAAARDVAATGRRAVEVTFLGQVWGTRVALDRQSQTGSGL